MDGPFRRRSTARRSSVRHRLVDHRAAGRCAAEVRIAEEPIRNLGLHAEVPIAFLVDRVLDVTLVDGGLGGVEMSERAIDAPWLKDYDAIKGEGPTRLATQFDIANWGLISAHEDGWRIGGAVVAFNTPGVSMLRDTTILPCCGTSVCVPRPAGQA